MIGYCYNFNSTISELQHLYEVFRSLNHQAELERLIEWAQRKRLRNLLKLYKQRLEDERVLLPKDGIYIIQVTSEINRQTAGKYHLLVEPTQEF